MTLNSPFVPLGGARVWHERPGLDDGERPAPFPKGLIDIDEFGEGTSQALAARARGELNAVTSDLPAGFDARRGADDIVELEGSMSSLERSGDWQVPRKLVLPGRNGSVKLDFTEARIAHRVVEIELVINTGLWKWACRKGRVLRWTEWWRGSGESGTTGGTHLPRGGPISS